MTDKLTKAQRYTLEFLETRPRPCRSDDPNLRRRIGMLRLMEERGLVTRNIHDMWSISRAGRAALVGGDQLK